MLYHIQHIYIRPKLVRSVFFLLLTKSMMWPQNRLKVLQKKILAAYLKINMNSFL